jgi:uncharacterized protein YkwD
VSRSRTLLTLRLLLGVLAALAVLTQSAGASSFTAFVASSPTRAHKASTGGARAPRRHGAKSSCRRGAPAHRHTRAAKSSSCAALAHHAASSKPRVVRPTPAEAVAKHAAEAAASHAATIANVLATPCQNTQLTPEPANLALVRAAVLCLINTERAQNGREPLKPDSRLEAAAQSHGKEMIALNYFDHIAPSGETPVERIRATGYIPSSEVGYVLGENLAWGTLTLSTPEAIVKAWIASPEHLANILEGKYVDTGIDVEPEVPSSLAEGVQGALYTQEFGVIVE